jgi:hypothetical protein
MKSFCLALLLAAAPAWADTYACAGTAPDWTLTLGDETAQFTFGRTLDYDIPQRSSAEGRDWPMAATLIAEFDTAIVVLNPGSCETGPIRAHILTQRGQSPIVLTGCCEVAK